ncbi:uncharacterized protein PGTG_20161 [Puccinia graminis f. sp. tritici CRL 75-36-700-3]|uniref:Uncharacterized protein n=1 Tax=Puccinia graminis f. sp. tritici (strain CRL 75-36-700-3 / race SCCL) TaxID=418459 RepID=E3NXE6_PUCGT|nr:uncharacterized protein PGTG_20161 [Puccinia graminis f. sp. tritici CRL 75-36-700-3]EFP94245.2 hypothetical protein PGTG_20161 [Puccinia graminis f. sp. tritici CRL 75-36-700-3]
MSEAEYSTKTPDAKTSQCIMSKAACPTNSPYVEKDENIDTIEDHGLLNDANEISFDSNTLDYSHTDYGEEALWAENMKLKKDLKKLKQKETKLSRNEEVILGQLQHSEEDRYALEERLAEFRDDCNAKAKLLEESLKQQHLLNLELDSMTSKWQIAQQEARVHMAKTEKGKQGKEIDDDKHVKQLSHSLQELQLKNMELQDLVESQEATILELNNTIGVLSSSKEQELRMEDEVSIQRVLLSEELARQNDDYKSTTPGETKPNTPTPCDKGNIIIIPVRSRVEISYRSLIAGAGKEFWRILSGKFAMAQGDDATVNAWWYLREKYVVNNDML